VHDARLLIAGSGRYERSLRGQVRKLKLERHVTFLGYLADPMSLLNNIDIFVYPSTDPGEVLPIAILEAMSAGVPVVATAVGSVQEVVSNEQTGLLTAAGDSTAIAHAVLDMLDNPQFAATLAESGRALVRSHYTHDRTSPQFLRLLAFVEQELPTTQSSGNTSVLVRAVHRVSFLNNTAILLASKVLTALATALWTILAARVLLPAAYGNLMLTMGLVELGAVITDAGLTSIATRELAHASGAEARALIGTLISLKVLLGVLATNVVILIAMFMPFGAVVSSLTIVLGPSLLFVALNSLTLVFRVHMSMGYVLGVSLTAAVFSTYGTVFVYWFAPDAENFVRIRLLAAVIGGTLALCLIIFKYRPHLKLSMVIARRLLIAGFPVGLALALNILYYRIDVPLLALIAGSTAVAQYTAAYRILDVFTLVPGAAAAMALPIMSSFASRNHRQLAAFATQYLELAVACGLFVGTGVTLFAGPLLSVLYAGRYDTSAPTLIVLGWVAAAALITNVFAPVAIALERQRALLVATAIGLAANLSLNSVLIPRLGALGAAYATLLTEFAVCLPLIWLAIRSTHMRLVTRPLVAALAATLAALAAYVLMPATLAPEWPVKPAILVGWMVVLIGLAPRWTAGLVSSSWKTTARFQNSVSLPSVRPDPVATRAARRGTQ
jgi:O-antigen/teichoic acid export membrane protein